MEDRQLSPHFHIDEFSCKCGQCEFRNGVIKPYHIDPHLIKVLEYVRKAFNSPVSITSGRRCVDHNRAVGGVSKSQHLNGTAADIVVADRDTRHVFQLLLNHPNAEQMGLGIYNQFVHVDTRGYKVRWGKDE